MGRLYTSLIHCVPPVYLRINLFNDFSLDVESYNVVEYCEMKMIFLYIKAILDIKASALLNVHE